MRMILFAAVSLLVNVVTVGAADDGAPAPAPVSHIAPALADWPDLFVHRGPCNVYILRDGDSAVLFNLGDGSVLDQLADIGVRHVDWILLTDHHREQCQGIPRVDRPTTKIAAPEAERALFEEPLQFRKWRPSLGDQYTVHGASYVRPPAGPIRLDRGLSDGETFSWRGHEIQCLSTPGHSPGGMSFLLTSGGRTLAVTGGVMHDGARMVNWYDTEWDYGFAKGLDALIDSVRRLGGLNLAAALPSQGPEIVAADEQFERYHTRLVEFRPDYIRGYPVGDLTKRTKTFDFLRPTPIPQIVQVTPHLYKFSDELAGKNFAIIISDSGRGLLLDCGLFSEALLHELVDGMQTHLGLEQIDALWINHMHGDHFTLGSVLQQQYGVRIWTLDRIADKVTHPLRYDYCALITSYNPTFTGLRVDRPLRDGEVVEWEGLQLHVDWMPGQTEFGNCLWLELDGKRIAFTGDNLFGDPSDPEQNGHEAVVARNSAIFEEGYLLGSAYLQRLQPDIIMGAHNVLMPEPAAFVDRYHDWSRRIIDRYRELLPDADYEYQFDPFWVSAYPYRVDLQEQRSQAISVTVRNFRSRAQRHRIELRLPAGVTADPPVLEGTVDAESRAVFEVTLTADPEIAPAGTQMALFDVALDDRPYGTLFDFLLQVIQPAESASSK
ncbi:MAG: MBL fold metallo-hydrolase [Planctomycetaceae bacterium]|nr:MBL fold metallo-hydrolase [Planctomycetaceae bacterium]